MPDNFSLSQKARQDLSEIWNYTAERWSEHQADKYFDSIINACQKIGQGTMPARSFSDILPDLLGIRVGRHLIFFKTSSSGSVEVLRILHESMDHCVHVGI